MSTRPKYKLAALLAAIAIVTTACTPEVAIAADAVRRPAATEFGQGPRASVNGLYTVTLQPAQALRLRQLQTVPVQVLDAQGRPVENATFRVDGGMPEHGHGLPTQPRVTRALGNGIYEIEGVRFSMGGWWELKLAIDSPAGADRVTFNLGL
ncbi:MAG TPA: FixH family protein [Usitatibacter sp.]|nr:FixH family protein [Usitatibacter sp.]